MAWRIGIRQLEAFRSVLVCGTVTGAADMMAMTQPAVSRLVITLEEQTGLKLFERRQGRLFPTAEAHWLAGEMQDIFSRLDQLDRSLRNNHFVPKPRINVVAAPAAAHGLLPRALEHFREVEPNVLVSIQIVVRRNSRTWIDDQKFDVGFITLPMDYPATDAAGLGATPVVCICAKNHKLASKKEVTSEDIADEPLVMLLPDSAIRLRIESAFKRQGTILEPSIETQTGSSVCLFVANGLGVALTDGLTAKAFEKLGLHIATFSPRIDIEYGLVFPFQRSSTTIMDSFSDAAQKAFSELNDGLGG